MTRHGLRKRSVRSGDRRGDARAPVMDNYHWVRRRSWWGHRGDDGPLGRSREAVHRNDSSHRGSSWLGRVECGGTDREVLSEQGAAYFWQPKPALNMVSSTPTTSATACPVTPYLTVRRVGYDHRLGAFLVAGERLLSQTRLTSRTATPRYAAARGNTWSDSRRG
jgi:hypothetical protein